MKGELCRLQLLSDCYHKYFEFFGQINETIALNNEILDLKEKIEVLNGFNQKTCFVALTQLTENQWVMVFV